MALFFKNNLEMLYVNNINNYNRYVTKYENYIKAQIIPNSKLSFKI